MDLADSYLERIRCARVYDVATQTPLDPAPRLSARLGNRVLLKREDLQPVFSFKLRGAHNKLMQLSAAERRRGVICSSAGNHAQGVALSARQLGVRAVVVMPALTAEIKVKAVRALGAEVVLHGNAYDDAYVHAIAVAAREELVFVHPFDDPAVIAGQGTIAMEILNQCRDPIDAIFVPVGGGGLASGIALYVKALHPQVRVIGVEAEESPSMKNALAAGRPVTLEHVGIFADGVAVRRVGDETFRICRELLDDIILVNTDEICAAIQDIFEDTRSIMEPAGALAVAGLKRHVAATRVRRPGAGGHQQRRQREFRPPAPHRRAGRRRRGARSAVRSGDSGDAGQLPASSARASAGAVSRSSTTATLTAVAPAFSSGWSCAAARPSAARLSRGSTRRATRSST